MPEENENKDNLTEKIARMKLTIEGLIKERDDLKKQLEDANKEADEEY